MGAFDDEIDRLYQLPLPSFTAERDALAKRAGAESAGIRRLQKPSVAAWAVNQVYWHRRKVFERLTTASTRVRAAHERKLAGKETELETAEAAHRASIDAAVDEARGFLQEGGDAASAATLAAIRDTFQTLVWSPLDGRLTRPLKPTGLEAIAGLLSGPQPMERVPAKVIPIRPARPEPESKADAARREAEDRRRKVAEVDRDLRAARGVEAKTEAALERATSALDAATREQSRLEAALEKATAAARERRDELHRAREQAKAATVERTRLEGHKELLEAD